MDIQERNERADKRRRRLEEGDERRDDDGDDDDDDDDDVDSLQDELDPFDKFHAFIWKRLSCKKSMPYIANDAKNKIEMWRQEVKEPGDDITAIHFAEWFSPPE